MKCRISLHYMTQLNDTILKICSNSSYSQNNEGWYCFSLYKHKHIFSKYIFAKWFLVANLQVL